MDRGNRKRTAAHCRFNEADGRGIWVMSQAITLDLPLEEIREYCASQPIRRLSVFGSALRNELTPESDIDLLVEYLPDASVGYFSMARHMREFSEIVGRPVDLCTPKSISRYFRQNVLDSAMPIYAKEP